MTKVIVFRGKVRRIGRLGYASIYVHVDFGGRELMKYIGKEVEGILVIKDENNENTTCK